MGEIKTCVIGSYPVQVDAFGFMKDYFDQREGRSWNEYVEMAVGDMVKAGVDIISDGQTRDPFIQLFARGFKGCRVRNRVEVVDKIGYNGPVTVEDQKFVRSIIPKDKMIKGVLTGPFTLSKSCVDLYYKDDRKMAFDFASALKEEAKLLEKHVDMISIDEPFFSNEMPDYGKELLDVVVEGLSCPKVLHVCGDVSSIVSSLLEMPVDVLSHEFKASPQLFDVFQEYSFNKGICIGSVRSDSEKVESVDEIVNHIRKAVDVFGEKTIQVSPDCGQRLLPKDVAYSKLVNLVKAGGIVNGG